jgi:TRAP-type C4-dicarboxylate transport system substrate-binding protein
MKKAKRIMALLLCCVMVFALCACGSTETETPATAPAEETPAPATDDTNETDAEPEPAKAEVEPYCFNISYGGTPSSSMVAVMTKLQDILSEQSNGAFTFNVYNDNSYKESQALDEMMNDIVDIVYLASGSTATTVTEVAYLGMPGCFRYSDDPDSFFEFEDSVSDIMSDIYASYGIHYLGLRVPARMAIVGTGSVVTAPADLNGKVVRVSGSWLGKLAVAMNIATANVGLSELATALQRKTIDSCITGIEQVYSQMLGEVIDYAAILPETDGIGALVMDQDTWDKLTDAQKACVEESVDLWMQACLEVSNEFYDTAVQHLKDNNVEIYEFSDQECDDFLYAVPTVYEEIDAQTGDLGHQLRDAILEFRAG